MKTSVVRVELPYHLQLLARVGSEISVEVAGAVTARSVIDAVEHRYPMLCGTIRDHVTKQRRPFLRYFGCQKDLSHDPIDAELPQSIITGADPFIIWGALSGG
ncbi:MAG: MoaD/ThiS family protein [Planctomycetaceae bacterium]|nr:MoaD/ThiS family protein [Planctomycetaceae bacterium]